MLAREGQHIAHKTNYPKHQTTPVLTKNNILKDNLPSGTMHHPHESTLIGRQNINDTSSREIDVYGETDVFIFIMCW